MKSQRRTVLHVDLEPFFVAVERSLDPSLRGRALVIGGDGRQGFVASASEEAQRAGVRPGLPLPEAHRLCPDAAFRRGDLEAYGRASEEVTSVLLARTRRVERPSVDEAFADLTPDGPAEPAPVRVAEAIREDLQRRLGLDASVGVASSRLAARIASSWARPRGLLVVLPGYEQSFLAARPLCSLELPPPLLAAIERAGIATLGQLASADEKMLAAIAGPSAARLRAAARGEDEPPIACAVPPAFVQEDAPVRDPRSDALALGQLADALARRAVRRLKPFRLAAGMVAVEVRRAATSARESELLRPALGDEDGLSARIRALAAPLLDPAEGVRSILVRLSRLEPAQAQAALFPAVPERRHA